MVIIAVDHSDLSLAKYTGLDDEYLFGRIRKFISESAIRANADGVVLNFIDFSWGYNKFGNQRVIVGLPDVFNLPVQFSSISNDLRTNAHTLAESTIKIGISINNHVDLFNNNFELLSEILALIPDSKWIIEPYFEKDVDLEYKNLFIRNCSNISNVIAFKLDLLDEETLNNYGIVCKSKPWLVRSDGMKYQDFIRLYTYAVSQGCAGAIVGAAIWKDLLQGVIENDSPQENTILKMSERIESLRKILLLWQGKMIKNG